MRNINSNSRFFAIMSSRFFTCFFAGIAQNYLAYLFFLTIPPPAGFHSPYPPYSIFVVQAVNAVLPVIIFLIFYLIASRAKNAVSLKAIFIAIIFGSFAGSFVGWILIGHVLTFPFGNLAPVIDGDGIFISIIAIGGEFAGIWKRSKRFSA